MGKGTKKTFLETKTRHTNCQQVHEKMLNVTNYVENANQNHSEILPHTR